jgi:asparagine synthase (glutamine-hydrolysing)
LISDVPVGVFLSGGIDSALVASVSSKFNPNIETLTVGFEDKKYDESTFANSYAKELKIRNKNILISASLAAEIIKKHNEKLSEPLADFSSLPMYFACNVANTRYKVMLSGDGGDEMFWGYPRYQWLNKSRYLLKIPSENLRRKIAGFFFEANEVSKFKLSSNTIGEANMKASQISTKKQIQSLFKIKDGSLDELRELFDFDSVKQLKILKYFQENDFYCFMQKVLIKVDRASMANSLEVRVPFLDERILQVVEQINPILGNSGEELKYISKQILFKYIDPSLIQKSKMGFTPPINQWIVDTLKEEINDIVNSKYCLNISMDYSFLRSYWISVKNNSNSDFNLIWSYYILFKFLERMQKLNVNG